MLDKIKYVILGIATAGAIGVLTLPFVEVGELRIYAVAVPGGHGYVLIGAFAVAAALAAWGSVQRFTRWQAIACFVAFLVAGMKSTGDGDAAGQTVALFAAFFGMLLALAAAIRPDRSAG